MIYCYTGTPGSGKSYSATLRAYELIHRPRPKMVVANYNLNLDSKHQRYFRYLPNDKITLESLREISNEYFASHDFRESAITLIIDECQLCINSRTWNDKNRLSLLEFMSQSRHMGYDVILVAQNSSMIDRQFRALIEYEVKHRKLANFGLVGRLLSLVAMGRVYAAVTYYYGLTERIGVRFFVPRKRVFRLYDSYVMFRRTDDSSAVVPEPE